MDSIPGTEAPAAPLAAEALVSAAFAAAGAGVYAVDAGGVVIACNPWAERLLGYDPGTLVGVDAQQVLNPHTGDSSGFPGQQPVLREVALGKRISGDRAVLLRRDGSALAAWWSAAPLPPEAGHGAGAVVVFHDMSAQRARDGRRADRYAHSETMREQAEYDLAEISWLSEVTLAMVSTLDAGQALERLVRLLVPRLADAAVIDLAEAREPRRIAWANDLGAAVPPRTAEPGGHPAHEAALRKVLSGGGVQHLSTPSASADAPQTLLGLVDAVDVLVVPVRLRATTFGALTLTRGAAGPPFNEADRVLAEEVARRTALGLENTRLHTAQADIAATLQRALLTELPTVPGLDLAAHYRPAASVAEVGGDWYDAFPLGDDDIALVIGDVVGHDIHAASRMSELRNMLRALAVDRPDETPGRILQRLDIAQSRLAFTDLATVIFARLHPAPGGSWELSWSIAGHPPPLLLSTGGAATYLTGAHGVILGARPDRPRPTAREELPAGSTLVLYTDGLIESRTQDIDTGMTRLRQYTAGHPDLPLSRLCAQLARDLGSTRDDVALIAARIPPHSGG
ncbi:SpoIIE family protein phosphatase [Amycolatopsis sp. A133]|uniref:SpoIIE family protein phosphatase n=1 Tax=Amycolatopsis sp. A133 TaxID=3064472 RepID=UPI0027F6992A|nr:SpoIIE family protein phosphatase [Amycolatopsis sp. A133]MDQ7810825.1 SpoIIE family protein phosphatase [Amycolatopsis sp. A133]